jgi:hypothetical protein
MYKLPILRSLLVALALVLVLSMAPARAQPPPQPQGSQAEESLPIPDLCTLLNYPYVTSIQELADPERAAVVAELLARPEATQLRIAMAEMGFAPDGAHAEAMQVLVDGPAGVRTLEVAVVPMVAGQWIYLPLILRHYTGSTALPAIAGDGNEAQVALAPENLSSYLVAMVADDGTSLFQAHHTNLDPRLAESLDTPIVVNGMPYFYITTLQVIHGRIVYWHYWWFDSSHHPNWYYAYYRTYWTYFYQVGIPWPGWHQWAYGWTYWRFWYYWSTYFPWAASGGGGALAAGFQVSCPFEPIAGRWVI